MAQLQTDAIGEGAPLVLVGGGLTGWASWQPHAERLAPGRRVIRVQPLAVALGLEDRALPPGYSIALEAGALGAALDGLGLTGPIDLVAWSYGAAFTLAFALDHPARVRTLTLIEPPAFWVLAETGRLDAEARRERDAMRELYAAMTVEVSEEQLAAFASAAGFCPPGVAARTLPAWPTWVQHRRSLRTGDAAWAHQDRAARLAGFARPVLLVKGTGSAHFLHQIVAGLAATLPRAELIELPGGHAPQLASIDGFLAALARFQAKVS